MAALFSWVPMSLRLRPFAKIRMKPIYVLNGPNLNLLGKREPQLYGAERLADIRLLLEKRAGSIGLVVDFRQTNHEGVLIDWVQEASENASGVIINAAGLSHTSIVLLDVLLAISIPIIEVHITNIYKRETFRQHSFVSQAADGVICGLGPKGYELALDAIALRLQPEDKNSLDV